MRICVSPVCEFAFCVVLCLFPLLCLCVTVSLLSQSVWSRWAKPLVFYTCPKDCVFGKCVDRTCVCNEGVMGDDCSVRYPKKQNPVYLMPAAGTSCFSCLFSSSMCVFHLHIVLALIVVVCCYQVCLCLCVRVCGWCGRLHLVFCVCSCSPLRDIYTIHRVLSSFSIIFCMRMIIIAF